MTREYRLQTPLDKEATAQLRAGDIVLLSGVVYTARDAAHKRFIELLDAGKALPFPPEGAVIYYVGPAPAPEGRAIGSAGPTTSGRMDAYAPRLYALGISATIGKGRRSPAVKEALRDHQAVYLGATGGAGALLAGCIEKAEVLAFPELGPEAVYRLLVRDMPLLVINDCAGNELYAVPDARAAGLEE